MILRSEFPLLLVACFSLAVGACKRDPTPIFDSDTPPPGAGNGGPNGQYPWPCDQMFDRTDWPHTNDLPLSETNLSCMGLPANPNVNFFYQASSATPDDGLDQLNFRTPQGTPDPNVDASTWQQIASAAQGPWDDDPDVIGSQLTIGVQVDGPKHPTNPHNNSDSVVYVQTGAYSIRPNTVAHTEIMTVNGANFMKIRFFTKRRLPSSPGNPSAPPVECNWGLSVNGDGSYTDPLGGACSDLDGTTIDASFVAHHEFGHGLGLGHADQVVHPDFVMADGVESGPIDRQLASIEEEAILFIYPP